MGDKTGISWTDATWNPTKGCSRISAGCVHCYAEVQAARIVRMGKGKPTPYTGLVKLTEIGEARWTGVLRLDANALELPLRWAKPRRIFVNSMSDLFHERLTNEQIAAVFGVMAACPQHTFQVLTKRAKRMREWFEWIANEDGGGWETAVLHVAAGPHIGDAIGNDDDPYGDNDPAIAACQRLLDADWPLPNVWLGVSVENQEAADERIPELLRTPAAVRFLSCEPLIGELWLNKPRGGTAYMYLRDPINGNTKLDWIIAGCESGPCARPCSVEWLRSLRDQCASAGVAFFLKQAEIHGGKSEQGYRVIVDAGEGSKCKPGGIVELPYLDGVQHAAFPEVERTIHG